MKNLFNNNWVDDKTCFNVINPYTVEIVDYLPNVKIEKVYGVPLVSV